jgi:hypothetical protein
VPPKSRPAISDVCCHQSRDLAISGRPGACAHGAAGPGYRWPLVDLTQVAEHTRFITNVDVLQQTLRGAVRRAIEDPSFAALFASDAMILGQWPLTSR